MKLYGMGNVAAAKTPEALNAGLFIVSTTWLAPQIAWAIIRTAFARSSIVLREGANIVKITGITYATFGAAT
jgi:hypothetical protein